MGFVNSARDPLEKHKSHKNALLKKKNKHKCSFSTIQTSTKFKDIMDIAFLFLYTYIDRFVNVCF